jgi:hypothetical protein
MMPLERLAEWATLRDRGQGTAGRKAPMLQEKSLFYGFCPSSLALVASWPFSLRDRTGSCFCSSELQFSQLLQGNCHGL